MLVRRRRRRANIKPTLDQCHVGTMLSGSLIEIISWIWLFKKNGKFRLFCVSTSLKKYFKFNNVRRKFNFVCIWLLSCSKRKRAGL